MRGSGNVNLGAFTYTSGLVRVSQELMQDTAFDLSNFLARVFGERFARVVNTHCTTGDGVAKPSGFLTEATLGQSSENTASIRSDELIELEHSLDMAYRRKARWMMSDDALRALRKEKTMGGQYMWQPNPVEGEPDMLLGYPYVINNDMPTVAPSAKAAAFGDFSKYFIRRITGARVLRLVERYADYNQIAVVAFQRWDEALIDAGTHPIKYLQLHAA